MASEKSNKIVAITNYKITEDELNKKIQSSFADPNIEELKITLHDPLQSTISTIAVGLFSDPENLKKFTIYLPQESNPLDKEPIINALSANTNITTLNITFQYFSRMGERESLIHLLGVNKTLMNLCFYSISDSDRCVIDICEGVKSNTTLKFLDLEASICKPETIYVVANMLRVNTTLTSIDLSNNECDRLGVRALAQALSVNTTLQNINLYGIILDDISLGYIAEALARHSHLQKLDLGLGQFGARGVGRLFEVMAKNTKVKALDISSNDIEEGQTISQIGTALRSNSTLMDLNLAWTQMTHETFSGIARALPHNTALTKLSLCKNDLTNESVRLLGNVIRHNHTLKEICLCGNKKISAFEVDRIRSFNTNLSIKLIHDQSDYPLVKCHDDDEMVF